MLVDQEISHDDLLTRGAADEPAAPMTEAERAAGWDDYEPRHVILGDEMYAPGIHRVRLGRER